MANLPKCWGKEYNSQLQKCSICALQKQCKCALYDFFDSEDICKKILHSKSVFCFGNYGSKPECPNCRKRDICMLRSMQGRR
jgi:uncharacterized protein (UPF0179 family)